MIGDYWINFIVVNECIKFIIDKFNWKFLNGSTWAHKPLDTSLVKGEHLKACPFIPIEKQKMTKIS